VIAHDVHGGRLSFAEERIWRGEQPEPDATAFVECPRHIPLVFRIAGPLDPEVMSGSVATVLDRHSVLRSRFRLRRGRPVRVVAPSNDFVMTVSDLRVLSEAERTAVLEDMLVGDVARPFDLATGPLVRGRLVRLRDDEHVLAIVMHHIVADGWSKQIIGRELARLYQSGGRADLPVLTATYDDYVHRQRTGIRSARGRESLRYWRSRLAGMPELVVPGDRRPLSDESTASAMYRFVIPSDLATGMRDRTRAHGATPGVSMAALFKVFLHRLTGVEDIAIGIPSADRGRPEYEGVVGLFLNLVVLRTDLSGNPAFTDVVERVRRTFIDAYDHADVPYPYLRWSLDGGTGAPGRLRVVYNFVSARRLALAIPDAAVQEIELDVDTPCCADLSLHVVDKAGRLCGFVLYKRDRFSATHIASMMAGFEHLMTQVLSAPERRIREYEAVHV
jgi:hypothetical protein